MIENKVKRTSLSPSLKMQGFSLAPTSEMINSNEGILHIYDITGKTILTDKIYKGKNDLFLPQDGKGIYIIKIQDNEKNTFNKKLVVY